MRISPSNSSTIADMPAVARRGVRVPGGAPADVLPSGHRAFQAPHRHGLDLAAAYRPVGNIFVSFRVRPKRGWLSSLEKPVVWAFQNVTLSWRSDFILESGRPYRG